MVKIEIQDEANGVTYVKLEGKLDVDSELFLKKKMNALIEKNKYKLIFDFKDVTYINSFGLGVLTNLWRVVKRKNGNLKLINLQPKILRLFQLTWLTKIFEIYDSKEEALKSFENQANS